jgi:hypothetical protein
VYLDQAKVPLGLEKKIKLIEKKYKLINYLLLQLDILIDTYTFLGGTCLVYKFHVSFFSLFVQILQMHLLLVYSLKINNYK